MTDVYLGGRAENKPCYWKNGQISYLEHAEGKSGAVTDILVLDNVPYSVGYDDFHSQKVSLWAGSNRYDFEAGSATSICACEPGYIYIGGRASSDKTATCWKVKLSDFSVEGTIKATLTAGIQSSNVTDICFDGNKVHMACSEFTGSEFKHFILSSKVGGAQSRTDLAKAKSLTGIEIKDGKTYVSGAIDEGSGDRACYWVDGEPIVLSSKTSKAWDIALKGNDVYVLGKEDSPGAICYWVNGDRKALDNVDNKPTFPSAIALDGDDVYVAGYYDMSTSNFAGFAMKNGSIFLKKDVNSHINSIATVSYTE